MRHIHYLINRHGQTATLNGSPVSVFIDEEKAYFQKKHIREYPEYSGVQFLTVLVQKPVAEKDIFIVDNDRYKVLTTNVIKKQGELVYTEAMLFKDDFVHTINIYKQGMNMGACNLPSAETRPFLTVKARLKTKNAQDYMTFALHNDKQITHVFTVEHVHGIETVDLITWGERHFEIVHTEEIDESHKIIVISCVEVVHE